MSSGARRVGVRAWCRADLAGGTLDIWPLGLLHQGACTVNVALDLAVEVEIVERAAGYRVQQGRTSIDADSVSELVTHPDTALIGLILRQFAASPVEVSVRSASPRGGGLGASSALTVAMIAGAERLLGRPDSTAEERGALARDIEAQLMGLPTGCQDHFPAQLGGTLRIEMVPGGRRIMAVETDLEALGSSLVIAYTGQSHFSAGNNWKVIRRRLDGDPATIERFDGIAQAASEVANALERGDLRRVGALMTREWRHRRELAPEVSTASIDELLEAAQGAGAWGGKVCGAGGGGCIAILAPPESRAGLIEELTRHGARVLATRPVPGPLETTVCEG